MSDPQGRGPEKTVQMAIGLGLLLFGVWLLGREFLLPLFPWGEAFFDRLRQAGWALVLVILGIGLVVRSQRAGAWPARGSRLHRSRSKRMVSGVLGGLSDYFGIDVTLLRLVYVGLAILLDAGPAILAYILASIIIPEEPKRTPSAYTPPPPPPGTYPPPPPPGT